MPKLEHGRVYRIIEREIPDPRTVIFRYIKTNYYDGDPFYCGVDLATLSICSLFPDQWEFQELSLLEQELY